MAVALMATLAEAGENWPQFRGPTCDGHSDARGLPRTWSETDHVVWKTPIPGRGWSSPVVWGEQVWLTTATADGTVRSALCVDRRTGTIGHNVKLFELARPEEINSTNSYASSTSAIDAKRVYVHFGSCGTACLDRATGKTVWVRRDLTCDHGQGAGSSVLLVGELVVLTLDGMDVQYLVALDKATGKTVWKAKRSTDFGTINGDLRKAYGTPIVLPVGGRNLLVSNGAGAAMAYDLASGREVWKVRYRGGYSNISRPVVVGGLVLLNTGFGRAKLLAVRFDGRGDVTDTHVAWRYERSVPIKPSPVVVDGRVYMTSDTGLLSCLDGRTGQKVWTERLRERFSASPIVAEGRIYLFGERGKAWVVEAGPRYKALAVNQLASGCMASPAVAGKALFVRTKTHLVRIEE